MGLFGFGKKKDQQPVPALQPGPEPVKITGEPYQYLVRIDGQWYVNPDYDPNAPKPEQPKIIGMDLLDDDDEDDDD